MPNTRAYDVFYDFTTDTGEGNWSIIFGYVPALFLKNWDHVYIFFQIDGITPSRRDCLKSQPKWGLFPQQALLGDDRVSSRARVPY